MEDRQPPARQGRDLLVSVIITTFNRRDALRETLEALARQTLDAARYELLVVDNGCSDGTGELLASLDLPVTLRTFRLEENAGIGGARNVAIREARGEYLVLVSDDLIVTENFLETHVETLKRFPEFWVVGGFQQLPSLTETPFGRYLDALERSFEESRNTRPLGPNLWEMRWPTARNLSLPAADLDRIGLFDPQFRNSCEDQDLAYRAQQELGTRFLYNAGITCLHNDQAGDLLRYCRAQQRGAHDTVFFWRKYQEWYARHGDSNLSKTNGPIRPGEPAGVVWNKRLKAVLAQAPVTAAVEAAIRLGEGLRLPERVLRALYARLIGIYIFRGWRQGLATLARQENTPDVHGLGHHSRV